MDSRPRTTAEAERAYDDFVPSIEWTRESTADTILVYLPGFRKEQLKVQVTSTGNLRIMGERQLGRNKWSRFREEIPISANYDPNGIGAKFEKGILFVKLPKIIVSARLRQGKEQPPVEAPNPQKATQEKAQSAAQVPKPDQNARQEKAQPPARVPKPDQKPQQEKAQPSAQLVPKPDQKQRQENARSTAEASKAKTPPATESVQPPEEKSSQEKDKRLAGDAKPEKTRGEPEGQVFDSKTGTVNKRGGQKDNVANATAALQKVAMEDKEEIIHEGKPQINGQSEAIIATASGKLARGNYMQILVDLARELKKPRNTINLVLAISSVAVFVLYVAQAIRSLKKSEGQVF